MDDLTKVSVSGNTVKAEIARRSKMVKIESSEASILKPKFNGLQDEPSSEMVPTIKEIKRDYKDYAMECRNAMRVVLALVKGLSDSIDRTGEFNPIVRIEKRIKKFKSVKHKCREHNYEFTPEGIRRNIKDVAGIRIVTEYDDEVYKIKEYIEKIPEIKIIVFKDYMANPKQNGYRSLHLGCEIEMHDPIFGVIKSPVEIQIRSTMIDDVWRKEHKINYKVPERLASVTEGFRELAETVETVGEILIEQRSQYEKRLAEAKAEVDAEEHD